MCKQMYWYLNEYTTQWIVQLLSIVYVLMVLKINFLGSVSGGL